jgi:hypothetical protein
MAMRHPISKFNAKHEYRNDEASHREVFAMVALGAGSSDSYVDIAGHACDSPPSLDDGEPDDERKTFMVGGCTGIGGRSLRRLALERGSGRDLAGPASLGTSGRSP